MLRDGETIATHDQAAIDRPALIQTMVGRALKDAKPRTAVATGDVALELRHRVVEFVVGRGQGDLGGTRGMLRFEDRQPFARRFQRRRCEWIAHTAG